jgi:hypothetical protein
MYPTSSPHRDYPFFASVILTIALALSPAQSAAQNTEVIDNSPFEITTNAINLPLFSIRPLIASDTPQTDALERLRITDQLLVDSARQFPEIQAALDRQNVDINKVDLVTLKHIIQNSDYSERYLFAPGRPNIGYNASKLVYSRIATESAYKIWDATSLINMMVTGVIDVNNVYQFELEGKTLEAVKFEPHYAFRIAEVYKRLSLIGHQPMAELGFQFAALRDEVKQYNSLEQSILLNVGDITFGRPTVYTSREKDLALPQSINRDFDVYWIDLAATFRDMDPADIDEMAINFATPEGTEAFELLPLVVSREFTVTKEMSAPKIWVEVGGATVTLGEVFKKTIEYISLKPSVVAYGLGERRFSWVIRDDAIRAGSHRFVAIVGVPKGSPEVEIAMSGHVRLKKGFLGGIFGEEGIAGSEARTVVISF